MDITVHVTLHAAAAVVPEGTAAVLALKTVAFFFVGLPLMLLLLKFRAIKAVISQRV